ncbi:MAG: helix-turn-helix domain-containing protein [Roseiflexaceae bacterium]
MTQTIAGIEYLDGDEAAALLGVKKATLYAYVSRGLIRSYKQRVGRKRLYRRADIEALRTIRPSAAAPQDAEGRVLYDVDLPDATSWAGDH